ncbi:MAG: DEAD/DEAH box helicase [Promethearchaeota archaeon]
MTKLKNFFIVLDSERNDKSGIIYNVNFFYIKTLKKKKAALSYVDKPFLRGWVLIGLDLKNRFRPLQFIKILNDGSEKPLNPDLFKKLILSEQNQFISFSKKVKKEDFNPLLEMLKNFQFNEKKILNLIFCEFCLKEKVFTILDENNQIKASNNRILCPKCALDYVLREIQLTGLIDSDKVKPKLKNFFNHMILKFKSVQKVLSVFKADFKPSENRDITLYDIEKQSKVSDKYLNYSIENLEIPESFKQVFRKVNISKLLPIQAISIENGLLKDHENQLIMAPTSGGKTLIGELAGVSKLLKNRNDRMLYVVPIVALANLRTEEFEKRYSILNLNIVKKIGESLLEKNNIDNLEDLMNAEIIIGTYEAIDYILRNGKYTFLGKIKTIVIDEIQTLIDKDRGFILDGFIARLKSIYPDAQYIYLSATLGEPGTLARKLGCKLIKYTNRPVPIERHLILCKNERIKQNYIVNLIRSAFYIKSEFGFRGQSIVFTNSRKKCENLALYLQNKGLSVKAYHSGLTLDERKVIEQEFQEQKLSAVVATAALAAGVDFPASQVIFESLAMGINWLTVAEFEQMLGRAGRLRKHTKGLAYLLVEPGKIYSPKMKISEENIAIKLLNGKIKDFEHPPDENKSLTELLAFISMYDNGINQSDVFNFYEKLINNNYDIGKLILKLKNLKLIDNLKNGDIIITELGRSIAKSFLTVDESLELISELRAKEKSILEIALDLKPLKNVYISKEIVADLSRNTNMKYFSNNFFSASVLSLMNAEYVRKRKKFSKNFIDMVLKWTNDIFNCNCKDNPFCECGRINLERLIFHLRTNEGFSISDISYYLRENYKIVIFKGDLIDYLENLIYTFESIKNISEGIPDLKMNYKKEIEEIPFIIAKIKERI